MSRAGKPGPPPTVGPRLDDRKTDAAVKDHAARLDTLANLPAASMKFIPDVELRDGIETPVAHGLGRRAAYVSESCVSGAASSGWIEWVRTPTKPADASKYVVLKASGYGATITVTVQVA